MVFWISFDGGFKDELNAHQQFCIAKQYIDIFYEVRYSALDSYDMTSNHTSFHNTCTTSIAVNIDRIDLLEYTDIFIESIS